MGLFGNKKPKLRDYSSTDLDGLLRDAEWAYAIGQAGIDVDACEVVLRVSGATIGVNGAPNSVGPAILFGQGNKLALAFPGERQVSVALRDRSRGQLQTIRSGAFQILFGSANSLDGFMFWNGQDNLSLKAPEGELFGKYMSSFMKGELKPGAVRGTPRSLVATPPANAIPDLSFDNSEDTLRWTTLQNVHAALTEMLARYQTSFEKAEHTEKAYGMANAEYVDGVRQHEISRESFRKAAVRNEAELAPLLAQLREATQAARAGWQDLIFLLPGAENDVMRVANWCIANGVSSEMLSFVVANSMLINTDFGLSRDSFWAENERVAAVAQGASQ